MSGTLTAKEYEIHFYEVNYKKRALMTSLIDYFNDVAIYQSEQLKGGFEYLTENHVAWILYKWDITVVKYPKYGEKVTVRTRPTAFKKFYGYRKFDILDENGEVLAFANSLWLLVDTNSKKPLKIPHDVIELYGLAVEDNKTLKIDNINKLEKVDDVIEFKVRYSDIDTNGHVNNEKYAAWMIESVPLEITLNYSLANIKITYKKETKYGELIKVSTQKIEREDCIIFVHEINREDGELLTLGETVWKKA